VGSTNVSLNQRKERKVKKKVLFAWSLLILTASLLPCDYACTKEIPLSARAIDPVVSTNWLAANIGIKNLVIIDMRSAASYGAGHIPNAINLPFDRYHSVWGIQRDGLDLEVPEESDLFKTIGSAGMKNDSLVVIVNDASSLNPEEPPVYPRYYACRVADTLIYAGVKNVAILSGGHTKWVQEGRTLSKDIVTPTPVTYSGEANKAMLVSRQYVKENIGKVVIIDAREPDSYFGATVNKFVPKPGHIPSAKSLPSIWIWNSKDGTFKDADMLKKMGSGVVGNDKAKEIIVYCGVGNSASGWWFVLTQILGYDNVKLYDGSAQEWMRYYDLVPYQWD
jgi:thiosulfate/3-mercaptopyruvate sulfurtransferase